MFVLVPNMVGGAMSLLALLVCIVLPRHACLQSPCAKTIELKVWYRLLSASTTIHALPPKLLAVTTRSEQVL